MSNDSDIYKEVISNTELTDYIEEILNRIFKKDAKTYNDDIKKYNTINFLKTNILNEKNPITQNIRDAEKDNAGKKKNKIINNMIKVGKTEIKEYLKKSGEVKKAYDNAQTTIIPTSLSINVPTATAIAGVLPTPTPISGKSGQGIVIDSTVKPKISTPKSTAPASAVSKDSPYEIILASDKMKFFVYNIFAHDVAHDLFPSNEPSRYKDLQKGKLSTATLVNWLATPHSGGDKEKNKAPYSEKEYLDKEWGDEASIFEDDEDDKNIKKEIKNKKADLKKLIDESLKETDEIKVEEKEEEILDKIDEIDDAVDFEIADDLDILGNELLKSVGLTLEQKGMLFVSYKGRSIDMDNKKFIIIDIDTIVKYFKENINEIYIENPIYPGFIYFNNEIFNPYDVTVLLKDKIYTIKFGDYEALYNINSELFQIDIFYKGTDNNIKRLFRDSGIAFVKVCNQSTETTRHNCGLNFKEIYGKFQIDKSKKKNPEYLSDLNNYIITELENDINDNFYDFYPDFLLKKNANMTIEKFNKLFNNFTKENFEEYYNYYKRNFDCFDNKVCNFLQTKEIEDEKKYEKLFEKDEIPSIKSQLKKNIQHCMNRNFLETLSKLFILIFLFVSKSNESYDENLKKIFDDNFLKECAENENGAGDKNLFLVFKQLIYLQLKNNIYSAVSEAEEETKFKKGGGKNDNDFINCAQVICTAVKSIMYYLKDVMCPNNILISTEIEICNSMITKHTSGTDLDATIINTFYEYTTTTAYNPKRIYYYNSTQILPTGVKQTPIPTKTFWEELGISKPATKNELYLISNAAPIVDSDDVNNSEWFCPLSSIIDGMSQCPTYKNKSNVIEKGTLFVTVRNMKNGSNDPNYMSYTVKVEPESSPGKWDDNRKGNHFAKVSVLLTIGTNTIINYGGLLGNNVNKEDALSIDLDLKDSYLDAKLCLKNLICMNIGLLQGHAPAGKKQGPNRSWSQLMAKIDSNDNTPFPVRLHNKENDTYSNASLTSSELRSLILRTSVIKSLGDYFQELNMVTVNSGYVEGPITIKAETGASKDAKIISSNKLRIGFSNDRPSGVRLLLLRLYGEGNPSNPTKSGINGPSIVGYYGSGKKTVFLAYDKNICQSDYDYTKYKTKSYTTGGGIYINKKNNNTKRLKHITRKIKIFKNRKITKRNNKGTRKRK